MSGGYYHGKLVFPKEYPFKPPRIMMITPNGRFQTNTRLCLSISDFHPDTWNPAWSVSTILTGLLSFMVRNVPFLYGRVASSFVLLFVLPNDTAGWIDWIKGARERERERAREREREVKRLLYWFSLFARLKTPSPLVALRLVQSTRSLWPLLAGTLIFEIATSVSCSLTRMRYVCRLLPELVHKWTQYTLVC